MAELIATEARPTDWLEVVGMRRRRFFGLVALQTVASEALTYRTQAGQLVAIAGIYAGDECWFRPGPACAANLRALVRHLAHFLDTAAEMAPGVPLRALIEPGSVAGPRLAAMLGFTEAGLTETDIGPLQTWRRIL